MRIISIIAHNKATPRKNAEEQVSKPLMSLSKSSPTNLSRLFQTVI